MHSPSYFFEIAAGVASMRDGQPVGRDSKAAAACTASGKSLRGYRFFLSGRIGEPGLDLKTPGLGRTGQVI
jgi:hypothetical protein